MVLVLADVVVVLIALVALLLHPQSESDGTLVVVAVIALLYFLLRVMRSTGRFGGHR